MPAIRSESSNANRAPDRSLGSARLVAGGALVGLGVLAFQLPIFDRWFSSMDEGHVLLYADLIARGGDLYRDATLIPLPGAFYILAQFFELFGPSILLSRWIVAIEFAAFVVGVWLLVQGVASRRTAIAIVFAMLVYRIWAFPHWQVYSYSTTSLLFVVGAVLCELRYFATRRLAWIAAAGLGFGLAVYCKQDYGAAALLVMAPAIVVDACVRPDGARAPVLAPLAVFVGCGALVGACVGAYFLHHGILGDLLHQTIVSHLRGIGDFAYTTFPPPWPFFAQDPAVRDSAGVFAFFPGIVTTVDLETLRQNRLFRETFVYDAALKLFFWSPYALVAYAAVRLARTRDALRDPAARDAWLREGMLAGLAAAFVLLTALNRPQDFLHLAVLTWPMLCLACIWLGAAFRRRPVLAWAVALALLVPTAAVVGYAGRAYARLVSQNTERIDDPRGGVRVKSTEAALIRDVTAFMHAHAGPDETIAVVPYFPIMHFLADRRGPDRLGYVVWPHAEYDDRDRQIIDAMEQQGTEAVVYNLTQFAPFPPMREFAPELYAYIAEHFEVERVFSYDKAGFMLAGLRRRTGPEPGESLLDARGSDAAVWIESDDGPPRALTPAERPAWAARELWPFRPALALRPSSGASRTVFEIPVDVRAGDVLRTAVAVHPDRWFALPAYAAHFRISVRREGDDARRTLWERRLDPHLEFADRGWVEIALPLDDFAGERVGLELSCRVDAVEGESREMGGWAEPRIVRVDRRATAVAD